MATYVQTDGTSDGLKWFMDIELTPARLKSGAIFTRLDTKAYPQLGTKP